MVTMVMMITSPLKCGTCNTRSTVPGNGLTGQYVVRSILPRLPMKRRDFYSREELRSEKKEVKRWLEKWPECISNPPLINDFPILFVHRILWLRLHPNQFKTFDYELRFELIPLVPWRLKPFF